MIKRELALTVYKIGRPIYRFFALNRVTFLQKLAYKILSCLMTEDYRLRLLITKFAGEEVNESDPFVLVSDVNVSGSSRLLVKGKNAYIPPLQSKSLWKELSRYKLQEEAQMAFRIDRLDKSVFRKCAEAPAVIEEKCFSALSPFSTSWVHWLFEIFPQLLELKKRPDSDEIRILVEPNAPTQIYETIRAFFPAEHIINIAPYEQALCHRLLIRNDPDRSWSVLWARNVEEKLIETYYHNMDRLKEVRDTVYKKFSISAAPPQQKIFIRRKADFRFIHNEEELANHLFSRDFKVIEPSSMSFREQVECFSNTKIIVAQAGAALANIIFMKPGSTIVCLAADSPFLSYDYFSSIAKAFGVSFKYVLGEIDDETKYSHRWHLSIHHPLNASFTIDKRELEHVLTAA